MSFMVRVRSELSHAGLGVLRASKGQSDVEKQDLVSERPPKRRRRRRTAPDRNPLTGDPSGPQEKGYEPGEERRVDIII